MRPRSVPANGAGRAGPLRTTPIALLARRHAAMWASLFAPPDGAAISPRAQAVVDHLRRHGALFFDELVDGTGLLRSQLEEALAELVGAGLLASDSFGGLRALLVPARDRASPAGRRRRAAPPGMASRAAGR